MIKNVQFWKNKNGGRQLGSAMVTLELADKSEIVIYTYKLVEKRDNTGYAIIPPQDSWKDKDTGKFKSNNNVRLSFETNKQLLQKIVEEYEKTIESKTDDAFDM